MYIFPCCFSSKATPQKTFRGRVRHPECQASPNLHTVQVQGMMSSSSSFDSRDLLGSIFWGLSLISVRVKMEGI